MADPRKERTPKEQEALYKAFAKLYCDASRPETFEKPIACYKALVDPDPPEYSLKKTPYRYLKNKVTQTEIARIKLSQKTVVEELEGLTHGQYVHELLQNARLFAERGGLGDSTAAAQLMKTLGTAMGYLVTKTEDVTPRRPQLTTMEQLAEMEKHIKMLKLLKGAPIEEAQYEIVQDSPTEEHNGRSTEEHPRSMGGPDDGGGTAPPAASDQPARGMVDVPGMPAPHHPSPNGPEGGEEE